MQFITAQVACLCFGIVAVNVLHKFGVPGFVHEESFGNILVGTLALQGASWLMIPFFLHQHQVDWRSAFGFRGPALNRPVQLAFACIIIFLIVWALQWASVTVLEQLGWPVEDEAAVRLFTDAGSWPVIGYLAVFAVVIAPVAEEFIFRGVLFPFVRQLGFPRLAWFGVSFLFALIHLNAPTFMPLFVFAVALTWLYERTDNLLVPITAHALFNAANLILLLLGNEFGKTLPPQP